VSGHGRLVGLGWLRTRDFRSRTNDRFDVAHIDCNRYPIESYRPPETECSLRQETLVILQFIFRRRRQIRWDCNFRRSNMFVFVSDAGSGKRRLRLIAKHHAELLVHLGFYALADWLLDLFRLAACGFPSSEHLGRWSICRERLMCKRLQGLEITDLICISNQIHLKIKLDSLSTSTG